MTSFYIIFFSFIGHKEPRFLLPILPFLFLMAGYGYLSFLKNYPKIAKIYLSINFIIEFVYFTIRCIYHD